MIHFDLIQILISFNIQYKQLLIKLIRILI